MTCIHLCIFSKLSRGEGSVFGTHLSPSHLKEVISLQWVSRSYQDVIQTILEPLILRRTKDMKDENGRPIVDLPEKILKTIYLDFGEKEKSLYDELSNYSRQKLKNLKLEGKADYIHVFALLLKMRQACDHPLLLKNKGTGSAVESTGLDDILSKFKETSPEFANTVKDDIKNSGDKECPVTSSHIDLLREFYSERFASLHAHRLSS
jgi:SNF2 family DNA or RNA helicase